MSILLIKAGRFSILKPDAIVFSHGKETLTRIPLAWPEILKLLTVLCFLAVELGQCKGISPVQEIVNMTFRAGRFWEAVGMYCVRA